MCIYVYIYIYICIHIHKITDKETIKSNVSIIS